jgi:hypothetical protein
MRRRVAPRRGRVHGRPMARPRVQPRARTLPGSKRDRRGAMAAAALALAALAWLFWPATAAPVPVPAAPPAPAPVARSAPTPRKVAVRKPPPPAPEDEPEVDEGRLRAAVLARAADLRACPVPAGTPSQVPIRLRVPASGEVRSVQLATPEALPPQLATCLRERLLAWRFDDLRLASDLTIFATFALR